MGVWEYGRKEGDYYEKKEITDAKVITDFVVDILRSENNRKSPKIT